MAPFAQKRIPANLLAHDGSPMGRPTEYRPEFCEAVIEFMAKGYSLTAFAGSIRKSRDQVYDWITRHRDFANAVSRARSARVTALETKLLRSRKGAETSAAVFALKNAQPEEWRDVKHTEHQHLHALTTLTDAQLMAIAAGNVASVGDGDVIDGDFTRDSETT